MKRLIICLAVLSLCLAPAMPGQGADGKILKLATTTSTENSGLLEYLLPEFEKSHHLKVHVIAVGTGRALKLAQNGDVDLVMVHAPEAELEFVNAGFGVNRRPFMKNDFIILGPPDDPAGLKEAKTLAQALAALVTSDSALFVSRADDSGTHKKELALWAMIDRKMPAGRYLKIGQGMEAALRMAHEKQAYTLSDRGTYLALKKKLDLEIAFQGDPALDNQYSVIATNPGRYPDANYIEAMTLIAWLTSPPVQQKIGEYKLDGEALFIPTAVTGNKEK